MKVECYLNFLTFRFTCKFQSLLLAALRKLNNDFILNGDFIVSVYRKLIEVSGTTLEYSGSDHVIERINCSKMLHEDIELLVGKSYFFVINLVFFRVWDSHYLRKTPW